MFWDIDGTLIRSDKAGLYAFRQAAAEIYGTSPDFAGIVTAGQTDCHIAAQIISRVTGGEPAAEETAALLRRYLELLPVHLAARAGFVIPPVREILEYLEARDDCVSLLLTGNCLAGARAKLEYYDIARFFDFAASAFGDDCRSRADIAARALASANRLFPAARPADIVVIGDTPNDIQKPLIQPQTLANPHIYVIGDTPNDINCGKYIGARTIAVATGTFSVDELKEHNPWWAVERLPSPAEFIAKLNEPF